MIRQDENPNRFYGFLAYDKLLDTITQDTVDHFGFRYCVGVFYERKDAILQYLIEIQKEMQKEMQKEIEDDLLTLLIDSFHETVRLYKELMFEILQEKTNGWNYLFQPIMKEAYREIIDIIQKLKLSEDRNTDIVIKILDNN